MQPSSMQPSDWHFVRKVLIVMVAAAIGYALFRLSHVLMLVFAAVEWISPTGTSAWRRAGPPTSTDLHPTRQKPNQ